jgi:RNA polymerase sigma-70 factor (ECF subfamily)
VTRSTVAEDSWEVAASVPDAHAGAQLDFDQVYEANLAFVWRVLAGLGVPETRLEDATQDVFVIVHGKLAEFEGRSKLTTWLYSIARHVALDEHRKIARDRRRDREIAEPPIDETVAPTPEEEAGAAEARRTLLDLLGRLDPAKREVFVLVEIEQVAIRDVARLLNIKENTAWSRLRLARAEFERHAARLRARDGEKQP